MKLRILSLIFAFFIFPLLATPVSAYQQSESVCYSQCAAYKFGWKGDFCWDLFQSQCSVGGKDMVNNMISLVKDTAQAMATGKLMTIVDVSAVFKGWFMCKPLIEECIVPQLNACESTCKNVSQTYYAPNLSVGTAYTNETTPSVFYSEERHELIFEVVNDGPGYAWDIDVTASWGHTPNRDKIVSGGGTLFTEKIPELLFLGARIGSPKEPMDAVTDFLIDESNISGFLSKYKSDANNHYVPPIWFKSIPFTAPEGEFTQVTFKVDPNNLIPESGENDNTFIYEINKLPTPFSLTVENLAIRRNNPISLTEYMVNFELKNSGEDSGNANIKWYEGNYESGKSPIYQQSKIISGLNQVSFDHIINVDVATKGGDSCNHSQKYTLVVFDDEGFIKTKHEFYIPLYAGSITGRVEDIFGKNIVGATVTASTGQTSIVDEYGFYHINGISILGKVSLSVTHPDFSGTDSKEVEIKYIENKDKCRVDGLTVNGVNFVLKDQDVIFTVTLKDTSGNPVNGHVLATNKISDNAEINKNNFRLEKEINGTGELGALQPGEYMFTISAGNYKTMAQTVLAVPSNQNLEFILEPILGRSNDGTMVIQAPQLLWQWDRGVEILSQVAATKDGKRVFLYTSQNKDNTGKIYFLDAITGNQIKKVNTPATGGNSKACLSTSYDGNTTALLVRNGVAKDVKSSLLLFNNQGSEFAKTDYICKTSGCSVSECSVSPDGFYIYPGFLINKSLYEYSRLEIEGIGGYSHMSYSSLGPLYFLHGNGLIAGCEEHQGSDQCAQYLNHAEITRFSGLEGSIRVVDSSFNDQRAIFTGYDKLFLYGAGNKVFEKDVNASGQEPSASISMGGQYIIYSHNEAGVHNVDFKIVNADDVDKTPNYNKDVNENVIFVHANDKGLFYLVEKGKTLKYYQVGKYTTEYNSGTQPTSAPPLRTTNLSIHINGKFSPAGEIMYSELQPGYMYRADQSLTLNIFGNGSSLHILEGTIFSLDGGRNPILLKGQITADFNSPTTIYAIKFDRFDLALFRTKLNQFWRIRTLPESEYFVVKNIHTKFTVKNGPNNFNVAVESGTINVLANKTEKVINSGKQISIDASNKVKESFYLSSKISTIIIGVLVFILSIVLFIYRKTKIGGGIIKLLIIIGQVLLKITKTIAIWIWKIIKKIRNLFSFFLIFILSFKKNHKKLY